jgi:hypothetical protein
MSDRCWTFYVATSNSAVWKLFHHNDNLRENDGLEWSRKQIATIEPSYNLKLYKFM